MAQQIQGWRPKHNVWAIAMTVTLATFMEVLDTSIANVALPHIAGSLSAGQDESTWILTSYLVSNAIVLPLSAGFARLIGRKRFYMICVAMFTMSSLLCGLSPTLPVLIFFRILQGAGGGGLQPSEQAILADTLTPDQRGMGFALYGVAVVVAPAIGPTLGGWITDNYSWHWIFFINVPIGILSLLLTSRIVEDPPYARAQKDAARDFDYVGISLIAIGLGFLQVVLDKGQREDWFQTTYITVFAVISAVGIVAAVWWELHHKSPMLDLAMLKDRNFGSAFTLLFVLGFVLYGSTVLLPQLMQTLMNYTAELSGMVLSPGGFAIMVGMPIVALLLKRFPARNLIGIGLVANALALFHMATFNLAIDFKTVMMARVYQSFGLAFLFIPINTAAYSDMPAEKNNNASSLINLARNLGGSFGISLLTTLLARRQQFHQNNMVSHLTPFNSSYRQMLSGASGLFRLHTTDAALAIKKSQALMSGMLQREAAMLAFLDVFWALEVIMLLLLPIVFIVKKNDPRKEVAMGH